MRLRSSVLLGISAVTVVCLCAPVVGAAKPKPDKNAKAQGAVPESLQVLVRLGNEVITRADVQHRLDELPDQARGQFSTPEGRQQLLDRIVEERVWLITALKQGVADRPQVRRQLEQQRRDVLIRTYLGEVMASNPAPADSEAKVWYDTHLSDYHIPATATLHHIQLKTLADAQRVKALATGGVKAGRKVGATDWNLLAERWSTDSLTRSGGGMLGAITKDGVFPSLGKQPALAESAFALGAGKIGGPYKTDHGWHVIKVDEVHEESTRPLDQVRPMIVRQLSQQRSQDYYKAKLDQARKAIGVVPDSSAIKSFVSQKKDAREMFKEAQELAPASDRVRAYQALLKQYPDSDVSAQAQFMIGFIYSEEIKNYDEAEKAFRELLQRYPKSELAASAQWMVEHMRSEEAPAFIPMEADSSKPAASRNSASEGSTGKP